MQIRRGDVFSEQAGARPVIVIQNDVGNEYAPTVIIAPFTTKAFSKRYPTNVNIPKGTAGLREDSTVLLSHIRTIDKSRLERRMGHLPSELMRQVDEAIKASLELT